MQPLTPQRLQQLLESPEALKLSAPAQERLRWIAEFVLSGDSISETCSRLHIARSTFHRWLDRFDPNDLTSLEERSQEQTHARSAVVPMEITELIRDYRERSPLMGKERIRELLMAEHNLDVSASTIGRVIERECLYFGSTPLHWRKRMRASGYQQSAEGSDALKPERVISNQLSAVRGPEALRPEWVISSENEQEATDNTQPTNTATENCMCTWCRFWSHDARNMRRFIGMASLLINVALIGMFLGTALWEKRNEAAMEAALINNAFTQISSPVSSPDGR